MKSDVNVERAEMLRRVRTLRAEIVMIFNDAAHWNRVNPEQEPIDPDPDGQLARCLGSLDRTLAAEIRVVEP